MNDSLRKAAILIDSLDAASADKLLEQLPLDRALEIRRAVIDLGSITEQERAIVVREFMRGNSPSMTVDDCGVELDDSLAERLELSQSDGEENETDDLVPFGFLHQASGETLALLLHSEHPQTIAIVTTYLVPERSADLLKRLPLELQTEVVTRIAAIEEIDPEIIREVEQTLQALLSDESKLKERPLAGLDVVRSILSVADSGTREELLSNLARQDASFASQLGTNWLATEQHSHSNGPVQRDAFELQSEETELPAMVFQFDELCKLDNESLARLLHESDPSMTILALTGARPEFVDRIMRQLSAREAKLLMRRLEHSGPLRLRDIDHAQQHLAQLAGDLVAKGSINIPWSRHFVGAA